METATRQLASKHAAWINSRIAEYEEDPQNTQIQVLGADLRAFLLSSGLAKKEFVHHAYVGVHIDNRGGEMLLVANVLRLLLKITSKGFAEIETKLALACMIPPTPEGEVWRQANAKLVMESDGNLAPYQPETLRSVTAVSSHTTALLRLIDYAVDKRIRAPPGEAYQDIIRGRSPTCAPRFV